MKIRLRKVGSGKTGVPCRSAAKVEKPPVLSSAYRQAFTLIEIMIVVIIIGVLAATIIPQFMGTTQDAKISAAKGHIAELEAAVERFNVHLDRYPTAEEGLKVLVEPPVGEDTKWRGPYVKQLRPDPWGNPYQYRAPGVHHATSFDLWSRGADNADGGEGAGVDVGNW
ncbi:MAG: type II secretion system major pseudopilin GspG [Akkermansiaceae bacterium]|nr:type II secretion system major pseudopilin GspG [Verrucomicrobiales bacterium]